MKTNPIKRIVVLMMENQSFDRLLGFVKGVGQLDGSQFAFNSKGEKVFVSSGADPVVHNEFNPPHLFMDTMKQLYGEEKYTGQKPTGAGMLSAVFPESDKGKEIEFMRFFSPKQIPALTTLAQSFVSCDRWFSSVPGPTGPNRLFTHTASSGGYTGGLWLAEDGLNPPEEMKTIFESLHNKNVSWKIYSPDNLKTAACLPYVAKHSENVTSLDQFFADAESSQLAEYTFVNPDLWKNSQHPGGEPNLIPGDQLIADVYEAIRQNDALWANTLLLITYDEAGGYYDSVISTEEMPPLAKLHPSGGWNESSDEFDFKYLGVRVPALLISAYLDHRVDHTSYEHASISASLKELFQLRSGGPEGFLTSRDQHANSIFANNSLRKSPRQDLFHLPRNSLVRGK
jgi:phospholipase C